MAGSNTQRVPMKSNQPLVLKQKDRPKAVSVFSMRIDQAAMSAIVLLRGRRYAMKPTPAKPKIIIAQVEGSGTAETFVVPTAVKCSSA
jgi:hypothetical protein